MNSASFIIGDGHITALAGGPLSLADMGARTTRRASHLIFADATNEWVVRDATSNEVLFTHPDYDVALAWEREYYNRQIAQ